MNVLPSLLLEEPLQASQLVLLVKNLPAKAGGIKDRASIPGLGRSARERNSNPLQFFFLENPMDIGYPTRLQAIGLQRVRHDGSD